MTHSLIYDNLDMIPIVAPPLTHGVAIVNYFTILCLSFPHLINVYNSSCSSQKYLRINKTVPETS